MQKNNSQKKPGKRLKCDSDSLIILSLFDPDIQRPAAYIPDYVTRTMSSTASTHVNTNKILCI